ncbi:unnamed protein product [Hydatigera taeniaeformis]|uniref:Sister-chromatide cohesion protein n=1 Tax=Hydatigena taeniaeformis TaxID=6205 RepID=A0A0R3WKZ8_HYDTA|nr:unnamed protein product [Hydatigera taeniaeformis]
MLRGVSKLAKLLASNELKTRKRGYKYVCELLSLEPGSDHFDMSFKDMLGVCKGLYYSLWMQDKLLLQEESAARIAKLISTSKSKVIRCMYIKAMFATLAREWDNLDNWREDKFMMLTRVFFVRCIESVKNRKVSVETLANAVFENVLNANTGSAIGLKLHLCLVIQQELLNSGAVVEIVQSFFKHAVETLQSIPKLYTKRPKMNEEQEKSIENPTTLNGDEATPAVNSITVTKTRTKRRLEEDHLENSEASPDLSLQRRKRRKKAEAGAGSSSIDPDQNLASQRTEMVDRNEKEVVGTSSSAVNEELGGETTKPEFDLSVIDQVPPIAEKKRVSFGKVVCRSESYSIHGFHSCSSYFILL